MLLAVTIVLHSSAAAFLPRVLARKTSGLLWFTSHVANQSLQVEQEILPAHTVHLPKTSLFAYCVDFIITDSQSLKDNHSENVVLYCSTQQHGQKKKGQGHMVLKNSA